jgi:glycosyltransferase involved in cell wall biosynthesis
MRALVVAYYFPPRGGAGTQRFAKFCKFLPQYGVQSTVLTSAVEEKTTHAPHDDATLLRETATEVVRVAAPARAGLGARLRRTLRLHVDADEWAAAAAERAVHEARARASEVIVTTLSPFAAWRVGARVQRELGIPWVVDLRDPWSLDGWRIFLTGWHARRDLAEMRTALRRADFVIANVPAARDAFVELGVEPGRVVVIPNGYDAEDFAAAGVVAVAKHTDPRFQLAHIGTFHGLDVGAGMTRNRVRRVRHRQLEPLGRTGNYLLRALAAWRREPAWQGRGLVLHLYGQVDATHRALIAELGLEDLVVLHGYVEHRASVAALLAADAVFVPLHGIPAGERALVVPGKLYEALASERPILAALPPGDGADLVHQLEAGVVVPPTDSAAIAAVLGRWTRAHAGGAVVRGVDRARLQPFTRQALTGLLAQVLEAAVRRQPGVQVRDPWQQLGIRPGG